MTLDEHLLLFWGKARPRQERPHPCWHPLIYHCLDVAAVGEALLDGWPWLARSLAGATGWPEEGLRRTLPFLLALHDIGKISRPFQAKAPEFWPETWLNKRSDPGPRDPGHGTSGLTLLQHQIGDALDPELPGWELEDRLPLLMPFLGHHGRPVGLADNPRPLFGRDGSVDRAGREFVDLMRELWQPIPLPEPEPHALARASWLLAGLAVLADWLGSSQDWFPYEPPCHSPADYLAFARRRARTAIEEAGVLPARPSAAEGLHVIAPDIMTPSAVQAWAEKVELPDGPFLALVEDVTGGGKTEAALVLAHRLMAEGRASGLYMALPTMATANAMFTRLADAYRAMFEPDLDHEPSLALAHGATKLHEGFQAAIRAGDPDRASESETKDDNPRGDESGAACAAWLGSEQRKAFLADVGVGTIDQAVLGVLPAKYQALRLLGLSRRVLIVDEAHAYDAYVGQELDRLLEFQAAAGGSAVVLSATLPAAVKHRLARAFRRGLGLGEVALKKQAYPLVTLVGGGEPAEEPKAIRPDLARAVTVERLPDADAALARIAEARRAGAAVAWVRNTVDDVLEGAGLLRGAGVEADIFHARFAMGDRLKIEAEVIKRFGKKGDPNKRPGILVASQVIEQSIDADLDLLVTDLASIDLLIQRMGRLWRHPERHTNGRTRPVPGPTLLVVSPEPDADPREDWYKDAFPRAAWVYRHHGLLWRTAKELFGAGDSRLFQVPEEVRGSVEAVYGAEALAGIPEVFERNSNEVEGGEQAAKSHAKSNLLKLAAGYDGDHPGWDAETRIPTRLSDPTTTLRLARWDGGRLRPMCGDGKDPQQAWALSEVAVRAGRAKGVPEVPGALGREVAKAKEGWTRYDGDKVLVPLTEGPADTWTGAVLSGKGETTPVSYTRGAGLRFG